MPTIPFEPGDPWQGSVEMQIMPLDQRMQKALELSQKKKGKTDSESVGELLRIARESVKAVDLTHVPSEKKISSLEELEMYKEGMKVLIAVGQAALEGVPLGHGSEGE